MLVTLCAVVALITLGMVAGPEAVAVVMIISIGVTLAATHG